MPPEQREADVRQLRVPGAKLLPEHPRFLLVNENHRRFPVRPAVSEPVEMDAPAFQLGPRDRTVNQSRRNDDRRPRRTGEYAVRCHDLSGPVGEIDQFEVVNAAIALDPSGRPDRMPDRAAIRGKAELRRFRLRLSRQ
ncbi:hypothetical protein SDC9_151332 [bioreactor metagenome]|uniref:Uncharacterized protein n=1 Tax=bioreactor metagenome TaxID=1076179 RepID=A0A645ERM4_9ZZZZ